MRHHQWIPFASLAGLILTATVALHVDAQAIGKKGKQSDVFESIFKLTGAERMKTLGAVLKKDDLATVERGVVASVVVERANLDVAKASDIVSRTRWLDKEPTTIVKWVVEDGTFVTKGEKVAEFDPTPYVEALRTQKQVTAASEAHLNQASERLTRVQRDAGIDVKLAEIEVKLAELALSQYKGTDDAQRKVLRLHVDKASLLVERVKLQTELRKEQGEAEKQAKKALHDRELAKQRDIETDLASCVMRAPHEGMVVYFVPLQVRGQGPGILAVGEPMREGQRLMRICDLKALQAITSVPEFAIAKVKVGQKVHVRVDAFPNRQLTGKVTHVSNVADQAGFFRDGVKVYQVQIAIDGMHDGLRPGMSTETTIECGTTAEVLRVPTTALVARGKARYCLVHSDKEIEVREVKAGLFGNAFVEISAGLKEGERVLRAPLEVIRLLDAFGKP